MTQIWTPQVRRELYRQLVFYYGPKSGWASHLYPPNGGPDYRQFCTEFARKIGAKSRQAVTHQIAFVFQGVANPTSLKASPHLSNYILNMAAAREAGFITHTELCGLAATHGKQF